MKSEYYFSVLVKDKIRLDLLWIFVNPLHNKYSGTCKLLKVPKKYYNHLTINTYLKAIKSGKFKKSISTLMHLLQILLCVQWKWRVYYIVLYDSSVNMKKINKNIYFLSFLYFDNIGIQHFRHTLKKPYWVTFNKAKLRVDKNSLLCYVLTYWIFSANLNTPAHLTD